MESSISLISLEFFFKISESVLCFQSAPINEFPSEFCIVSLVKNGWVCRSQFRLWLLSGCLKFYVLKSGSQDDTAKKSVACNGGIA